MDYNNGERWLTKNNMKVIKVKTDGGVLKLGVRVKRNHKPKVDSKQLVLLLLMGLQREMQC